MLAPLLTATTAVALLAAAPGDVALRFTDERVDESSGLVASSTTRGVLLTHNDSGDPARFFAVDGRGRTLSVHTLPGTEVRDVEDAALGPGPALYLADVGDNGGTRRQVRVLRVPEPRVDPAARRARVRTARPTRTTLTYEDGARDAEALLVHPRTGQLLLVTKSVFSADVYAAPVPLADGVLRKVASVPVRATRTPGGPDLGRIATRLVTGGAVSPDGRRLAVRTYTDAYVFDVPGEDLLAAFAAEPTVLPLPATRQGEGITWSRDGRALLTSTEGRGAPVHRVPVPAAPAARSTPSAVAPPRTVAQERSPLLWAGAAAGAVLLVLLARRRRR